MRQAERFALLSLNVPGRQSQAAAVNTAKSEHVLAGLRERRKDAPRTSMAIGTAQSSRTNNYPGQTGSGGFAKRRGVFSHRDRSPAEIAVRGVPGIVFHALNESLGWQVAGSSRNPRPKRQAAKTGKGMPVRCGLKPSFRQPTDVCASSKLTYRRHASNSRLSLQEAYSVYP
jgi:hypothetical protein